MGSQHWSWSWGLSIGEGQGYTWNGTGAFENKTSHLLGFVGERPKIRLRRGRTRRKNQQGGENWGLYFLLSVEGGKEKSD